MWPECQAHAGVGSAAPLADREGDSTHDAIQPSDCEGHETDGGTKPNLGTVKGSTVEERTTATVSFYEQSGPPVRR